MLHSSCPCSPPERVHRRVRPTVLQSEPASLRRRALQRDECACLFPPCGVFAVPACVCLLHAEFLFRWLRVDRWGRGGEQAEQHAWTRHRPLWIALDCIASRADRPHEDTRAHATAGSAGRLHTQRNQRRITRTASLAAPAAPTEGMPRVAISLRSAQRADAWNSDG